MEYAMDADVEQVIAVAQLSTEILGQAQVSLNLYLTTVSGYLLTAYFIGKDLTRAQCLIITVLFVVFAGLNLVATWNYFENAVYFGHTYGEARTSVWAASAVIPVLILGILASLKFMWDVRHPKTE